MVMLTQHSIHAFILLMHVNAYYNDDKYFLMLELKFIALYATISERMEKEMQKLLPSFISEGINVLPPPLHMELTLPGLE